MKDDAAMVPPNRFRDPALQERRDDQVRPPERDGFLRDAVGDVELDRNVVARHNQLRIEPLRQAVECVRQDQYAHQQILGSCSPVSQSTTRRPPKRVSICTNRCGSSTTSPMIAASRPWGCVRMAASRRLASSAAQIATSLPSFATYSGSSPRNSHAALTCGSTGIAASSSNMPTPDWRAISFKV